MGEEATPTTSAAPADHTAESVASLTPAPAAAAPEAASTQTPAAPATPAPSAGQSTNPGPWADALSQRFQDETVRGQVDGFLRETVQPYITQREQELGQVGQIWDKLWDESDGEDNASLQTYLALTEARFGPQVAMAVAQSLQGFAGQQPAEQPAGGEGGQNPPELDEWLAQQPQEVQDHFRQTFESEADKAYADELSNLASNDWTVNAGEGALFSNYVIATDGDIEAAHQLWEQQGMKSAIEANPQAFGVAPPQAAPAAEAAPEAPQVLGTGATGTGVTTPPTAPEQHDSLAEAVDSFFKDLHAPSTDAVRGL
jgi:hypothetical protein